MNSQASASLTKLFAPPLRNISLTSGLGLPKTKSKNNYFKMSTDHFSEKSRIRKSSMKVKVQIRFTGTCRNFLHEKCDGFL